MEGELYRFFSSFFENSMLKFFDDLFNHVIKETEGIECSSRYTNIPLTFPLYNSKVGKAVVQILGVVGPHIDQFFETVQQKINDDGNLRKLISLLGTKFLNGGAENTLFFLTVTARFFSLMYRRDTELTRYAFISDCVKALEETSAGPNALSGFRELPLLVESILGSENWLDKFQDLSCGDASDYFPSDAAQNIELKTGNDGV